MASEPLMAKSLPLTVDFKTLIPPKSPNYFLMCPTDLCATQRREKRPSHLYPVSQKALSEVLQRIMAMEPRTELIYQAPGMGTFTYIQRSFLFRFPDYLYIQIYEVTENISTIAIYRRSKYGFFDFNVNKNRSLRLINRLRWYAANPSKLGTDTKT